MNPSRSRRPFETLRPRCLLIALITWFAGKKVWLAGLLASFLLAGCAAASEGPAPTSTPTPFPTIAPTPTQPAALPPGSVIVDNGLEVSAAGFELGGEYTNEYGIRRAPPAGSQYLWAQLQVRNTTGKIVDLPLPERFSVLYREAEQKYSYGHRQGYADYTTLKRQLPPEGKAEGWLRFELPVDAQLEELTFAFTPEGAQVSLDVPDLGPWTEHPLYLWRMAP